MTEDNTAGTEGTSEGGSDDNAVIKALRAQIRDLEKEVKAAPDEQSLRQAWEAEQATNAALDAELTSFGIPTGIRDSVKVQLGEEEITRENVGKALTGLGFELAEAASGSEKEDAPQGQFAQVTKVAGAVQAATGGPGPSDADRIANAKSREEIKQIAQEGGFFTQS